jgi:peptidoglycan/xylan/chitin deacetylase (PgdA/CDA1 family)
MSKAYLTIDDGPSEHFTALVDFLHERNIPAIFFNRGDCMDARPEAVIYGIQRGYVMANHTYSHSRAAELSLEETCDEIRRTDDILNDLYARAGVKRSGKYFRFPYMDRGMGACLSEPGTLAPEHEAAQQGLLSAGLGHVPHVPDAAQVHKKRDIQQFLKSLGYANIPAPGVTMSWYAQTEMASTIDSLCTYSTSDWALLPRHVGKHGFKNVQDLKDKIDGDRWLNDQTSSHIILAHDQADIHDVTKAVIKHMITRGFEFC